MSQDYAAKVEQEISQLRKKLKTEHEARVTAEEELEQLERTMTNLTQENSELKASIKDHEEVWKEQLKKTCDNLETAEAELTGMKKIIIQTLAALIGKSIIHCVFSNPIFLQP